MFRAIPGQQVYISTPKIKQPRGLLMPTKLTNKTAIITGASSGIGFATAERLAEAGANVVLAARRKDRLDELHAKLQAKDQKSLVVQTDVTDKTQVQHLVDQACKTFGSVDYFINNAGVMPLSYMDKGHVDEWESMVDINIKGVLFGIAAVLPLFKKQKSGHLINVGSIAGRRIYPGGAVYCATKHAVRAISEGLRRELAGKDNIRITTIAPGAVATELTDAITDEDVKKSFAAMLDMEIMQSEDIADGVYYALTQPTRVNVDEIIIMPTQQAF
jgi:NADP-dependent 3-hydroxy acid dehydrogenase YdfG